jgi:hypothetical protein
MATPTPRPRPRRRKMKARTRSTIVTFIMGMLCGIVLILTMRPMNTPVAYVQVPAQTTAVVNKAYTAPMPQEDAPGADCRKSGNHICGPGNAQKVKPGLYNRTGRLVVTWKELKEWGVWKYGPPANAK